MLKFKKKIILEVTINNVIRHSCIKLKDVFNVILIIQTECNKSNDYNIDSGLADNRL